MSYYWDYYWPILDSVRKSDIGSDVNVPLLPYHSNLFFLCHFKSQAFILMSIHLSKCLSGEQKHLAQVFVGLIRLAEVALRVDVTDSCHTLPVQCTGAPGLPVRSEWQQPKSCQ